MLIDRTHRRWCWATGLLLVAATAVYLPYHLRASGGPSGGSAAGLVYGVAGFAAMLYAALLGARRQVPVWRVGRAQTWMRGHLWLGLASLPLILFHSGFALGGTLTRVTLFLLVVVVASGLAGAALQHWLPRVMTAEVPLETIYEEIASVRRQLAEEAERVVEAAVGVGDEERARLRAFYREQVRPFLVGHGADPRAVEPWGRLRGELPRELHGPLEDLESICEERRQLGRQTRLHRWLHGWLLVHVPLSLALLLLAAVHAVMALRY